MYATVLPPIAVDITLAVEETTDAVAVVEIGLYVATCVASWSFSFRRGRRLGA